MSTQISAIVPTSNSKSRHCADHHPSLWGAHFLTYPSKPIDATTRQKHEAMKEEVRRKTITPTLENPSQKRVLQLIDAVQRLGIAYHFQKDIEDALVKIFQDLANNGIDDHDDLYTVSLRFRLLRQQGINISSEVFNQFKNGGGKFKESFIKDVESMLSLYEAAYLGIRGEEILDEAIIFTTTHLKSMVPHVCPDLAQQINSALYFPLRKAMPRLKAREYFDIYERDASHDQTLLKFAKLDFNIVQAEHQKELCELTRWWRDLDFGTILPYARNGLVELFFWVMEMCAEPKYSFGRISLTKAVYLISVIDDTFDAYGTFEELQLFTEAAKRWDIGAIDILPEYMKIIYKVLLDTYNEIEEELAKEGRSHCVHYAKEKMQELIELYLTQAKWLNEGYVPTMEDYMSVASISISTPLVVVHSFLGIQDFANEDAFKWICANPKILIATSALTRLLDDVAGHEVEQKRGHSPSAVECYMKQYGVSTEEAVKVLNQDVENAWKDINEEYLTNPTAMFPLLQPNLNLSRACNFVYKDGERYANPHLMKDQVASLLKDPVML